MKPLLLCPYFGFTEPPGVAPLEPVVSTREPRLKSSTCPRTTRHYDGHLRFWDVRTGAQVGEVADAHAGQVTGMALTLSGQALLSCGKDNQLKIVDLGTFKARRTFGGPHFRVGMSWCRPAFSPSEQHVAAGSADGCVHVWCAPPQRAALCWVEQALPSPRGAAQSSGPAEHPPG